MCNQQTSVRKTAGRCNGVIQIKKEDYMKPENTVKLLLDLEYVKKLQNELPSNILVILTSSMQFLWGVIILAYLIKYSEKFPYEFAVIPVTILSLGLILFSAYTYFGFLIRKRYILLIESLIQFNKQQFDKSA